MRLINCSTLQLEEFVGRRVPRYAILSHTWGDEEVSFADLSSIQPTMIARGGYQKILYTCQQARDDGLDYAWIDTCCIDKSSSSELSEAINSMFAWYKNSACCYAYLSDVLATKLDKDFSRSRWFRRGWTLQELLAPEDVIFYDEKWVHIGTKLEHAQWISDITGIDEKALLGPPHIDFGVVGFGPFCVAKRMSWASARRTTRAEDMAYCLLGIFDVNMPLLYGEGDRAFLRLQEEIIRKTVDDSILAWGLLPGVDHPLELMPETVRTDMNGISLTSNVLASSPKDFVNCADLSYAAESISPFTLTNTGLQIQLPLVPVFSTNNPLDPDDVCGWIGLLSCSPGSSSQFIGILLCPEARDDGSNARVARARIYRDRSFYSTVVVGSRAAVRSVPQTVTITGFDESRTVRDLYRGYWQFVINQSSALQDIGYHVRNGTGWSAVQWRERGFGYNPTWDAEAMVLTIDREETMMLAELIEFCFEPLRGMQNTSFTVFIRTIDYRATIREGVAFSEDDKRRFFYDLNRESSQHDMGDVIIHDSEGSSFQVSVGIRAKRVYDHRLFEVNIDAVQVVSDETTSEDETMS